jgi:hypothetical protein
MQHTYIKIDGCGASKYVSKNFKDLKAYNVCSLTTVKGQWKSVAKT